MRRRTNDFWRYEVMELTVSNDDRGVRFGPDSVLSSLQVTHAGLTEDARSRFGQPPSKASIGRIQHEARGLPKGDQEKYLGFFWPESMEKGFLPWEASGPLLHLLQQDLCLGLRPQIPVCRWYWKLYQIAPDAPHNHLEDLARMLDAWEMQGPIPDEKLRGVEGWLAFRGWLPVVKGQLQTRKTHAMAVKEGLVPPFTVNFDYPSDADFDDKVNMREMFYRIRRKDAEALTRVTEEVEQGIQVGNGEAQD
jgi:hypothetical protein